MTSLDALLRKDRQIVLVTLAGLIILSWAYLVLIARQMGSPGMGELPAMTMEPEKWGLQIAFAVFMMWLIMMVGMMLPSAAPMILLNAALLRKSKVAQPVQSFTNLFLLGYLASWTIFSVTATASQWWLADMQLVSPMMKGTSAVLNGSVLIAAGAYQWLPLKQACLRHCRTPAVFLAQHRRPGASGALLMGLHHGAYCVGCCWVLMLLLFVGGVMNLLWIAFLAAFVLIEKLLPFGVHFGRIGGAIMIIAGVVLAI
jgi:predicted metal-binding membrane protein